ncbi:MAG: hypothetical protein O7G83_13915 [Proteobacteria bacterium]|nr:hypothetical protein [Pseudomonadota bacterium]
MRKIIASIGAVLAMGLVVGAHAQESTGEITGLTYESFDAIAAAAADEAAGGQLGLAPLVGTYAVGDGPFWGDNPPTFTCLEACALVFGGAPDDYNCSTVGGEVNNRAFASTWGSAATCFEPGVAEDFKVNDFYDCGAFGCSVSAYVGDNCGFGPPQSVNFCFQSVLPIDIDIKFCSDPNAHNCRSKGVLPVTIFGTADLDVTTIDLESLQLCTANDCTDAGLFALGEGDLRDWSFADRGDPNSDLGASQCAIDEVTGEELDFLTLDTFLDLDAAFDKRAVSALLDICDDDGSKGDLSVPLFIQGSLMDGRLIISTTVGDDGIDQLVRKNR